MPHTIKVTGRPEDIKLVGKTGTVLNFTIVDESDPKQGKDGNEFVTTEFWRCVAFGQDVLAFKQILEGQGAAGAGVQLERRTKKRTDPSGEAILGDNGKPIYDVSYVALKVVPVELPPSRRKPFNKPRQQQSQGYGAPPAFDDGAF